MDKRIIRTWLLNKKSGVYSVIVHTYYDRLTTLKTSLFLDWLSIELEVTPDLINKASFDSALRRYRVKFEGVKRERVMIGNEPKPRNPFDTELPDLLGSFK